MRAIQRPCSGLYPQANDSPASAILASTRQGPIYKESTASSGTGGTSLSVSWLAAAWLRAKTRISPTRAGANGCTYVTMRHAYVHRMQLPASIHDAPVEARLFPKDGSAFEPPWRGCDGGAQ